MDEKDLLKDDNEENIAPKDSEEDTLPSDVVSEEIPSSEEDAESADNEFDKSEDYNESEAIEDDGESDDDDLDDLIQEDDETDSDVKEEEIEDDFGDLDDDDLDNDTDTVSRGKNERDDKKAKKKAEKERRKKEARLIKGKKNKKGLKIVPYEIEEDNNPVIKVYNEMARHAYDYDETMFSREGLSNSKLGEIFNCVVGDFPELFWIKGYKWDGNSVGLNFRCKKPNGELDIKQIESKLRELKSGARFFTRGISKRTDPYKALLMIYKRLILTLDYDGRGLEARIDLDYSKDDRLRSLHSALVRHKTVCAGYAVAMQYLLQSIGIPCAFVCSEERAGKSHAFNIAKIGKYCYYIDVTWGDRSNTLNGSADSDKIDYDYCCVPYDEFIMTGPESLHNHIPNHNIYPWFKKELKANRHEYYRYNKAFVSRYNEEILAAIFASTAKRYNPKEDGRFCVSVRCTSMGLSDRISSMLSNYSNRTRIVDKAKKMLGKDKRAIRLLDEKIEGVYYSNDAPVVKVWYAKSDRK